MLKLFLVVVLVIFGGISFAQLDEVKRITKQLCSEEFHGRGYYQKGDSIAADFLADEFQKLGIKPYKRKEYLQQFDIQGVNIFSGNVIVQQGEKQLEPGIDFMLDPSSGPAKGTYSPFWITADTAIDEIKLQKALKSYSNSGKNAIGLYFAKATGDTLKKLRGIGAAIAENICPVIEVINRKFTWSVGREQLTNAYLFIQDSILDRRQKYELDIEASFDENYNSQNVIAYLPAKKRCSKTVVFTAHYDHLGRMGHHALFPGANDNASGTAMLFTMARYFKEHPVDYNVMFIAFAGEEAGLLGSQFYVEQPFQKLSKIRFLVNLDIMGSGEEGITAVNATLFEEEFSLLHEINDEKQLLARIKKRGPAANSDHYWFTEEGVPAFFIYTMGPNKNYHDVFDRYEELSFAEYDDITSLLVQFVERLK